MRLLPFFTLSAILILELLIAPQFINAQAQELTPSALVKSVPINVPNVPSGGVSQAEYNSQMNALKVTYRNQLGIYRTDEKTFQLAKDQYYQIQTLASLEEAVRSTRQVMLSRLDVIQTYFTMAKLTLENTKGLETDVKAVTLKDLDSLSTELKIHRAAATAASDRTGLLAVTTEFAGLDPRISTLSNKLSYLVAYGRLQTVGDKTSTIKKELQEVVEQTETAPLKLAERKRGLDEVQRNLNQVDQLLVKMRSQLNPVLNKDNNISSTNISADLSIIYGGLSRSITYLQELVKN